MKVSLKWLSEYTAVPEDLKAFCDRLDLTGTGVEGVEKTGEAFEGVVVGHVLTCEPHPDSDHMHVVTVDVGVEEPVQIVCGAPNIAADIKVPVALVGAVLPGRFQDQEIEAARRGELRHVLLEARAGTGAGPFRHLGASRRCAGGPVYGGLHGRGGYRARPGDHAEPAGLPVHGGHGPRGGRHVPAARWPGRFPAMWRNWLP